MLDAFNFFRGCAETAITSVQISTELSETSNVLASQPGPRLRYVKAWVQNLMKTGMHNNVSMYFNLSFLGNLNEI